MSPEFAKVGDDAEAMGRVDSKPRASRLQVATADDARGVRPWRQRSGGSCVEFIAVGSDHHAVARMSPPGED